MTSHLYSSQFPGRLGGFALFACLLLSPVLADQVTLKNGDRVTGIIVKKDGKDLTIKTDHFGVVTTPWDQVASITTAQPVNLVLTGDKVAQGVIATSGNNVEVTTSTGKLTFPFSDVTVLRDANEEQAYEKMLHPNWGQMWAGTGAIGLAGVTGNSETLTFTTAVSATRATNNDSTNIYFRTIHASAFANGVNATTASAVNAGASYNHNISPRWFYNAFTDWTYDKFQDLDLRSVFGGGIGLHAWKNERSHLDLLLGADYARSKFSTPLIQNAAEVFFGDDYAIKLNSATSLTQSFRIFNDLVQTGDYRINFDVGSAVKLTKWLNWNLTLSSRYLSDPAPGRKTNDFLYATGFGINFSTK
jgi:putative salt-induced outer membrane protein